MEKKKINIMSLKYLRSLILLTLIVFGFVTIIASGGGDDDDDPPVETPTYSISGTITSGGEALANITVALSGDSTNTTLTGDNGIYTFSNIENGDYTITPSTKTGYEFNPVTLDVTVNNANVTGKDFTATQISAAVFLHYSLPDQYTFSQNGGIAADEPAALFSDYDLTENIVYAWTADLEDQDADGDMEELIPAELVSGYALTQFVDKDTVNEATPDPDGLLATLDARELYAVAVYSHPDDGAFSNRSKFLSTKTPPVIYTSDLRWDQFDDGYLLDLNYTAKTFYPITALGGLSNMYNCKWANDIYMFRKIDVKRPDEDGSIATFEVQGTAENAVSDDTYFTDTGLRTDKFVVTTNTYGTYTGVKAISLDQFITTYVTDHPENYTYKIVALDDTYQDGWTWANMQDAYYLPDLDLIIQVDSSNNPIADTKINFPVRIEVMSGSPVEYIFEGTNPPAYVDIN